MIKQHINHWQPLVPWKILLGLKHILFSKNMTIGLDKSLTA
jgi:hypothetical protein